MKQLFSRIALCLGSLIFLGLFSSTAYADGIVLVGPSTLRPDGVGIRTILSLQSPGSSSSESGGIGYNGSRDFDFAFNGSNNVTRGGTNNTVLVGSLGINNASQVRIGFNINEPNGGPGSDPVMIQALVLNAYDTSGNVVFSASLLNPETLALLGNGQGTADYVFRLDDEAARRFSAVFSTSLRLGVAATILNAQGGPESFYLGSAPADAPVPEPMTMVLFGTGLAGVAARSYRRRSVGRK
jgi:hypothetical protein